ncbi:MAG: nucleotide-binding protein [Deltaproteobacteria bacterium]|nr:nucleotide-binding protein [Deltaproteobacteria bacterium]
MISKHLVLVSAGLISIFVVAGCNKNAGAPPRNVAAGKAVGGKIASGKAVGGKGAVAAKVGPGGLVGTVLETMDASSYTYLRLKTASGAEAWAAVSKAKVKVGAKVAVAKPHPMQNFHSSTLNRTFPLIYFGNLGGGKAGVHGMGGMGKNPRGMGKAHGGGTASDMKRAHSGIGRAKIAVGTLAKAKGGYRVAEIFAQRKTLAGKKVIVRGKVTKFNPGIMGKNWFHVQDGSGDATARTHDLTVTSPLATTVKVGDVVLIEGTLASDKTVGPGYSYRALLEGATLKK